MKAFSFQTILKNFGKQLFSLASQMPWCNLRFNLGSISVLSRVSRPFSRTSFGTSSLRLTCPLQLRRIALILCVLVLSVGQAWGAINNTTVTKAGSSQKYIDVKTTAASNGDEVTVAKQYIAYTINDLISSAIKDVWYTQSSSGSGSSNTDAVSITGYRAACNKYIGISSSKKYTHYVTNCVSFSALYDPRGSGRYCTITATNVDDAEDVLTITNSGTVSSGNKYNVELTGLAESKYYRVVVNTNNSSESRIYQIRLGAPDGGVTKPSFSPATGSSLVKSTGTVTLTSSGNTVYYKWSQTDNQYASGAGATLADAADGSGTSPVNATAPSTAGTWYLYAVAKNGGDYSNVVKATYTITNPTHKLTWNLDGGTATGGTAAGAVAEGATLTAPTVTKVGYDFAGWSPSVPATMPAADATYTATWTKVYASGTYNFYNNATLGTAPNQKTITTSYADYDAFRIDNIFFSAVNMAYESGSTATGSDYAGWKIKKNNATIKFFVENDSKVTISVGRDNTLNVSYTNTAGATQTPTITSGNSSTYSVKGGTMVTLTMSTSSTITIKQIVITDIASCTAPESVTIDGAWDKFGGETISLTATATGGSGNYTYQWQKKIGDNWNNIEDNATATTNNLIYENCDGSHSGTYRCVVSTGADCSTVSDGLQVKVYTLECYNNGTNIYHFTRNGNTQSGTLTLTLAAKTTYEFKVHVDNDYYGNNGIVYENATNWVCATTQASNLKVFSGYGGAFTFTIDYSTSGNSNVLGEPEVSVTYPENKTIYVIPSGYTSDNAKLAIYYWNDGVSGWSSFLTKDACSGNAYYAEIPSWTGKISIVRLNSDATVGDWEKKWNKTEDIIIDPTKDQYTVNTWCGNGCNETVNEGTYTPATYSITFNGNGNTGGSMSNLTGIACGANQAITANAYTRTGYSFAGWKANVNVTIGGSTVTAGTVIANSATIQNISQNITLTAQWSPIKVSSITVSPASKILNVGGTQQLSVEVLPATALDKTVTWSTSNGSIATVSNTGLVTAVAPGSCTITATANDGSGVTGTCAITVNKKTPTKQTLTLSPTSVCAGGTATITMPAEVGVTYQLYHDNSTPIDGTQKTASTTTVTWEVGLHGNNQYKAKAIENAEWQGKDMNNTVELSQKTATSISSQPSDVLDATVGVATSLSVTAAGENLSYQWKQCATEDGEYANVASGGTSATYNVTPAAAGTIYYKVVVTGDCGTVTSDAARIVAAVAGPTYTVTFNTNGGSAVSPISQASTGASITMPSAPTYADHTFQGWVIGGTTKAAGASYTPTANVTAYALWRADCAGGGGGGESNIYSSDFIASPASPVTSVTSATGTLYTSATAWSSPYTNYFATDGSAGYYQFNFSTPLSLSDYTSPKITVYWGAGANRPLNMSINGGSTTQIDAVTSQSDRSKVRSIEVALSVSSISSIKFISSDGGQVYLFRIEITGTSAGGGGSTCYYVTYDGNGAETGCISDEAGHTSGSNVSVLGNTGGNAYVKSGYTFTGWNTLDNGSGTPYAANGTITGISGNMTLYAQWEEDKAEPTEPTVTWFDVPATVYPGQQFTFMVETNTDATLNVSNLTATNATLVNQSVEGGVFTATAQIAADAAAAPTFTLSTAEGTSYAAKEDTKSGITLGSCESSSGTATLFAFTCTSTTTAINTYSATGGTAMLSNNAMPTEGSNEITISGQTYYKFSSSSLWTMALSSGTFAVGDVITFTMACSDDKSGKGVILNDGTTNEITLKRDYAKNTAQESSYTVTVGDGIAGQSSFTIKRNDSDIKFGTVTVTRAGQSLDNKQETTIEWPETVDGVRVVEYEEGLKVPSLAIISSIGEATYTSNNEDVGSFRNGNVELTGTGNVTITVSVAAAGCMEAAESSYVLTVTNKRYTVEKGTITAGCDVTLSATSVSSGEVVTLTPVPADGYSLTSWDVYKKGDSNTKVTVTNNRFTMPDYDVVVNATFTAKSTVATLDALSVTNADTEDPVELSPTFASGTTAYTATLSCGTTSAPRISATKTDSKATTRLTNVSDLSGDEAARTATIVVTAEDGVTTQTYTIVFTVSAVGCVRLAPSITSISEDEDICSGGSADLSVTAESRNNDGGTLSYQWQKYNGASWDDIAGATEADYTTEAITVNSKFRCVVSDTKDEDVKSTTSDEITIGVTSIATPTYTQGANVVTLSCATEGATIWYSTDGNDPAADADNSRQGTSVSITRSGVTVKAIAYLEGCHSAVMTLTNADYSSGAVDGSIIWSMKNAGNNEAPKFNVTCVPNTILSAATAFTLQNDADYGMSKKDYMSVKISGITSYSADGKHVSLDVTVADGYTFTPCSLSVTYQPVSNAAKYKAVIGDNTSSESSSVSGGTTGTQVVNFTSGKPISAGTTPLHLYVYGSSLATWHLAGDIILYGRVQTTGTTYYSVTYNRNGATSGTVPQDDNLYTSGQTVELAANTGNLAKTGSIFSGWSTSADGTALTENPTITGDMTLYAVWTKDESLVTEVCANVTTDGTYSSIAVGDYSLYFSSSNEEYNKKSVKSSTANKCDGTCRYYMPGVVVALTGSNATTIKLKGQQDYDLTVSKVMVADALDGAWREISFTPVAYKSKDCGEVGISGVQIAQGKYVFLGFTGGAKNEFRISGLCITPFVDACPAITIVNTPIGDTWAKDAAGVQISVGATTTSGTLSYQWQESTDNTNFSDIDAATGTTYDVPTGTVGTKYYRCVVSNGSCSKNSESAKIVIVEPTVTALYEYWYIKQGRMTPDIALFEVTKGTPASNVTIPAAEIGKYGFVYNASDYKIYLQGSAPSAIYADENVEVTASIKSNSNADNITLHLLRATPHPQLAFVVTGTKGAGFENYDTIQTTCDLYTQLALDYIIQPTNVYHTTDEKAIRAYYSQFDIILNTDFPDTQKGPNSDKDQWNVGYVNALGAMVDIVPILTMEAFVSRLPNWKIKHDPKSPSTKQYSMLLNCRAHEIFGGIPDSHMGEEIINGEEHKVVTIVDENGYTGGDALQGFSADDLADMDVVGQIHNGTGQLMACVERQYETTARMMVLGINSAAMVKLTEDGIKVVKNALIYLQHKNAKDVSDCSLRFDNKEGDNQWSTEGNWAPGYSTLPTSENKVIILADCELDTLAHVDMAKINEDVKLTIKPTGALIVDGTITRFGGEDWLAQEGEITPDNLAIEADASNTGALILSNPEGKIGAEVQMYSKSYWETVDGKKKKYWSYVGVPIANVDIPNYFNQGFTYLYTETAGWEKKWDGSVLQPFEGIGLSMQSGHKETFYGNLASTLSRKIALTHGSTGENLIGNSWTAPIQIANFDEADFGGATAAVYVYNTGRDEQVPGYEGTASYGGNNSETAGQWVSVPVETAKEGGYTGLKVIPAMNAFQVNTTAAATLTLDYDKLVRKNAASNGDINDPMRAPRRAALKRIDALMRIRVSGEKTHTDIWLQQDERFSEGFDNGWEAVYAECDNRSAQLYAVSMLGQMSFIAKPYLEGTPIGFAPSRDGNIYTFSFQYDGEEVYYLNDLKEQKSTLIEAGETYTFTYEEGEMSPRFLISVTPFESPAITTGIENPEKQTSNAQKIIYNDKLYIIRGGRLYDATGKVVR